MCSITAFPTRAGNPCETPCIKSPLFATNLLSLLSIICHKLMIQAQDDQLDMVGHSVGVLKTMGKKIGDEIEEQNL